MAEEVARCPHCGTVRGGTAAALDALYGEVAKLRQLAERPPSDQEAALKEAALKEAAIKEAAAREADLLREVRLLRETIARLRGGIVTLRILDILFPSPTMNRHFHTERGRRCLSTAISTREVAWSGLHLQT